jgi:hypothetical protein
MIDYTYDDGGRAAAGYKGHTGDCITRAFAIAAQRDYQEVYDLVIELAKAERPRGNKKRSHPRTGVWKQTQHKLATLLGATWTPTMSIGSGTTVHLHADELPGGRIVASVTRHAVAVIDGVAHDTYDPSREGTRAVYGIWTFQS